MGKAVTTVASQGMMVGGVKKKGRLVLSNFPTTRLPVNDAASSSRHGACLSRDGVITSGEDVSIQWQEDGTIDAKVLSTPT